MPMLRQYLKKVTFLVTLLLSLTTDMTYAFKWKRFSDIYFRAL